MRSPRFSSERVLISAEVELHDKMRNFVPRVVAMLQDTDSYVRDAGVEALNRFINQRKIPMISQ